MFRKIFLGALGLLMVLAAGTVILNGCGEKKGHDVAGPETDSAVAILQEGQLPGIPPKEYPNAPPKPSILSLMEGSKLPPLANVVGVSGWTIINTAYTWYGVPYCWGGNSRSCVDCSHLIYQVYRSVGVPYPYFTVAGMKSSSRFICVNPDYGDIITFRYLDHAGIYVGNGWMVDANSYYGYVKFDYIWDPYWSKMGPYAIRFKG